MEQREGAPKGDRRPKPGVDLGYGYRRQRIRVLGFGFRMGARKGRRGIKYHPDSGV